MIYTFLFVSYRDRKTEIYEYYYHRLHEVLTKHSAYRLPTGISDALLRVLRSSTRGLLAATTFHDIIAAQNVRDPLSLGQYLRD